MDARAVKLSDCPPNPRDFALDFILFEHAKHRLMCNALDALAQRDYFNEAEVATLADFIRTDLAAHIRDEEEVLFPLLQERCEAADEIGKAIARLDHEHAADQELGARVRLFLLESVTSRQPIGAIAGAAEAVRAFAHNQRRHMMLENAVLIPLARRRLSSTDLADLGRRLAVRTRRAAAFERSQEHLE